MMKSTILLFIVFALVSLSVANAAQPFGWTAYFPNGTSETPCDLLETGNYDLLSLATDSQGRLWQFNGRGCEEKTPSFLRCFDRSARNWTVAWTDADAAGPAKANDHALWIDKNDNLYVFGGTDNCAFWKYSIAAKNWTDLTVGNCSLNSVQKGVENAANYPGHRRGATNWYTADDNSLWIFGGWDDSFGDPRRPDLWRFNITSGKWAFVAGLLDTITTDDPVFANAFEVTPFQRWGGISAVDADNNLWLFGGELLDDLWMFNRSSGWQYISGNKNVSSYCTAVLTTLPLGVFSSQHRPDCSAYSSMTSAGKNMLALWTSYSSNDVNRLWLYNITSQEWAYFMNTSGDAVATVLYVPDSSTTPGRTYYTRTNAPNSLWIVSDESSGVYVMDFDQCALSPCSEFASCTQNEAHVGPICTCNEGYQGDGFTCAIAPMSSPVASNPPVTTNSPKAATSSASQLSFTIALSFVAVMCLY